MKSPHQASSESPASGRKFTDSSAISNQTPLIKQSIPDCTNCYGILKEMLNVVIDSYAIISPVPELSGNLVKLSTQPEHASASGSRWLHLSYYVQQIHTPYTIELQNITPGHEVSTQTSLVGVGAVVVQEHFVHDHNESKNKSFVHTGEDGHAKCVLVQDRRREGDLPCYLNYHNRGPKYE